MTHTLNIAEAGVPLAKASKALILLHGRGGNAQDMLALRNEFSLDTFYTVAPQATNSTWYPNSFLAPITQNEPWLSSAIDIVAQVVDTIYKAGISHDSIYILGFSQGACLALEFAARYAQKWGGVIAFTGGLIGDEIELKTYKGDFQSTPIFIGNSDKDPHVPLSRSQESAEILTNLGAKVVQEVYPAMPHTICEEEITAVNYLFFGK